MPFSSSVRIYESLIVIMLLCAIIRYTNVGNGKMVFLFKFIKIDLFASLSFTKTS